MKEFHGLNKINREDRPKLLATQLKNLEKLENKFNDKNMNNPRKGHGGTPDIFDNSKGRAMIKVMEKHERSLISINEKIELQKEKIERTISRYFNRITQTKKSIKFIEKNKISNILFEMEKDGKVNQWAKNPQLFFVVGLKKVALMTLNEKVGINVKYRATNKEDFEYCNNLIKEFS